VFRKIADKLSDCVVKARQNTCPACKYLGLVYHDNGTAGCALCGLEIRDREEVAKLRKRGIPSKLSTFERVDK